MNTIARNNLRVLIKVLFTVNKSIKNDADSPTMGLMGLIEPKQYLRRAIMQVLVLILLVIIDI